MHFVCATHPPRYMCQPIVNLARSQSRIEHEHHRPRTSRTPAGEDSGVPVAVTMSLQFDQRARVTPAANKTGSFKLQHPDLSSGVLARIALDECPRNGGGVIEYREVDR